MDSPISPAETMTGLLAGFMTSQALYAVAKLDVLTFLDGGGLTLEELAERTGAHQDTLGRIIRTLAPLGVFTTNGELITATATGATLSRHHPESVYEIACFWMETSYLPFSELTHTLRTGETAATRYLGEPYVDWVTSDPERAGLLSRAMAALTAGLRQGLFSDYELPPGAVIADIGGADGSMLVELLQLFPDRRGIVLDLPTVAPLALQTMKQADLEGRVEVVAGDFFTEAPIADIYVLSSVLHDWDDTDSIRILRTLSAVAASGSRLLIIENVVPAGDVADMSKTSDLLMMGIAGGRERSVEEFATLLSEAEFQILGVVPSTGPYSVIEAQRQ
ncbi:methyltransferase [Allobranchiibius huperziae]|uniref:Methyltransferase n=1 Tax=Allobranchiibius huperziae TaxID=1874116 RepID=A0A853DP12_9MICO|nr:methyltransferase [Allobranchiibius huperziae]NYJ76501.1 hypothetical protein [Allobranchiibius huperziae]